MPITPLGLILLAFAAVGLLAVIVLSIARPLK